MRFVAVVLACLAFSAIGCAKGGTLIGVGGGSEGGGSTNDGGFSQSGGATNNNVTSGPSTNNTTNGPTTTSGPSTTTTNGPSTTTTTGPSTVTSTSTGMQGDCDPQNPAQDCGAGMHCVPQPAPPTTCEAAGGGLAYSLCATRGECADIYECVSDGFDACCMRWCRLDGLDGGCGGLENCTPLGVSLYANGVEYGVCWDSFPCVI